MIILNIIVIMCALPSIVFFIIEKNYSAAIWASISIIWCCIDMIKKM
jgi:hypothetical protein